MDRASSDFSGTWVFVDDDEQSAEAYCDSLRDSPAGLQVTTLKPSVARNELLTKAKPAGVLMDVELSAEAGVHITGLGLAQDIRAAQKAKRIAEYPIIRFARAQPVLTNVGGDPTSDDLFDDKIDKADVGKGVTIVRERMAGVRAIYDAMSQSKIEGVSVFGLGGTQLEWLHPSLLSRVEDGLTQSTHVAAGVYLRSFLNASGPLIDRQLLFVRLGLEASNVEYWDRISSFCAPFAYGGIGCEYYKRWWARGLEEAWYSIEGIDVPLALTTVSKRVEVLSRQLGVGLKALSMPPTSPGDRPWRLCALSLEGQPPEYIPVDPKYGVRITPRGGAVQWLDPPYASYGMAIRNKNDRRLNASDLERIQKVVR